MKPNPAHRGDPMWLADVLRYWGVTVKELPGWKNWGHGDFNVIWGVMCHHTGANNTSAQYIARNPGLGNGLSSQIHLDRSGVATMCGVGIAWHAGRGEYPGIPTNNANAVTIGIEAQSDGTSPWPKAELDAYKRICAAICWYLGLPANRVISHKEYAGRAQGKWDPGGIDMARFRSDVQALINAGPRPAPAPQPPKENVMAADLNTEIEVANGQKHRAQDLIKWTDERVFNLTKEGGDLDKIDAKLDRILAHIEKEA